jgi:hypothetical protein
MEGLIIAGGLLGTIYLATLMHCVMWAFDCANFEIKSLWSIPVIVFDGFKMSLIVFFWLLVGVAWFIAMLSPLFLSFYFAGFFN